MPRKKSVKKKSFNVKPFVLNCIPSVRQEDDWTFEDAIDSGVVDLAAIVPASNDLREDWWEINNQGRTRCLRRLRHSMWSIALALRKSEKNRRNYYM